MDNNFFNKTLNADRIDNIANEVNSILQQNRQTENTAYNPHGSSDSHYVPTDAEIAASYDMLDNACDVQSLPELDFDSELNKEQRSAVESTEGAVLLIAGAGTGKTKTLVFRLANIIKQGTSPRRILLLTFTTKAAKEIMDRTTSMLGPAAEGVIACNYHAFCVRLLRQYSADVGLSPNFVIHDSGDSTVTINLVRSNVEKASESDFPKAAELKTLFSSHVNKGMSLDFLIDNEYTNMEPYKAEIKGLFCEYSDYKLSHSVLDYDDLLFYANKLLRENPSIAREVSDSLDYIMVDEYQDSNGLQLDFLRALRQFDNKNICVVGDDQQCIYGFRGSKFENILNFPEHFAPCNTIILTNNYRSNQEILDVANSVISKAKQKFPKDLVGQYHVEHKPLHVITSNSSSEAEYVVSKICELYDQGEDMSEIGILARGSADTVFIEALLQKINWATFQKFGGQKFLEMSEVGDIFAFLKVLVNPNDEVSWFRLFQLCSNIGPVYAKRLTSGITSNGIDELLDKKHTSKKYGKDLPGLHASITSLVGLPLLSQITKLVTEIYPDIVVSAIDASTKKTASKKAEEEREFMYKVENKLYKLIDISKGFETAAEMISSLTLEPSDASPDVTDKITISTIHSSKGLEFKHVFIVSCVDTSFPSVRQSKVLTPYTTQKMDNELEEERRVFYVAVTRAKNFLHMVSPKEIMKFGKINKTDTSRFLEEIYLENEDMLNQIYY